MKEAVTEIRRRCVSISFSVVSSCSWSINGLEGYFNLFDSSYGEFALLKCFEVKVKSLFIQIIKNEFHLLFYHDAELIYFQFIHYKYYRNMYFVVGSMSCSVMLISQHQTVLHPHREWHLNRFGHYTVTWYIVYVGNLKVCSLFIQDVKRITSSHFQDWCKWQVSFLNLHIII